MQVAPIKPTLKAPGTKRLKLKYEQLLSTVGFNFNLRRYNKDAFENEIRQVLGRALQSFPDCLLIVYQCVRTVHARRMLLPGLATHSHFSLHLSRFVPDPS